MNETLEQEVARLRREKDALQAANRAAMDELLAMHQLLRIRGWRATKLQGLGPLGALVLKVVK